MEEIATTIAVPQLVTTTVDIAAQTRSFLTSTPKTQQEATQDRLTHRYLYASTVIRPTHQATWDSLVATATLPLASTQHLFSLLDEKTSTSFITTSQPNSPITTQPHNTEHPAEEMGTKHKTLSKTVTAEETDGTIRMISKASTDLEVEPSTSETPSVPTTSLFKALFDPQATYPTATMRKGIIPRTKTANAQPQLQPDHSHNEWIAVGSVFGMFLLLSLIMGSVAISKLKRR